MTSIPVILDTDIGTDIDDTWALAMLLNCPELAPRLVLTTDGDTIYRARLAAKFLHVAGRPEIPVGIGFPHDRGTHKFQEPWLGEYPLSDYPGTVHENGLEAMITLIMDSPVPVTIIAIGVATNLARALEIEPRIAPRCRFVGMHGSIHVGYSGMPGAVLESNVRYDPGAFRKTLAAPWQEKIITPLDT